MDFQTIESILRKDGDVALSADASMKTAISLPPAIRGFAAAKTDREAFDYVLNLIHSDKLSPEQQTDVMHDTLDNWCALCV
jgi:hypothetical protein